MQEHTETEREYSNSKIAMASASPSLSFATYRVRNIPSSFEKTDLTAIIPLHDESEWIVRSSLSPDIYTAQPSTQVGTLTFNTTPRAMKDLKSSKNESRTIHIPHNNGRDAGATLLQDRVALTVDSHFTGFTPLNSCAENDESTIEYVISAQTNDD